MCNMPEIKCGVFLWLLEESKPGKEIFVGFAEKYAVLEIHYILC